MAETVPLAVAAFRRREAPELAVDCAQPAAEPNPSLNAI